jgi:hypothetical protein
MSVTDSALGAPVDAELEFGEGAKKVSFRLMITTVCLIARECVEELVHIPRIDGASRHSSAPWEGLSHSTTTFLGWQ